MPRQPQLQPPRRRRRSCRRFQVAPAPRRAALDSGCDGAARRMGVSQSRIITLITGHRYAVKNYDSDITCNFMYDSTYCMQKIALYDHR